MSSKSTIPKKIGSWSIVERVGGGGQAEVLRGRKTLLNGTTQEAAIKVIPFASAEHAKSIQLLAHESDVLQRLRSPHIASVLDSGFEVVDGIQWAWMATELIKGDDLSTELTKFGPLSKQQWLELAFDLFSAVSVAHQEGVIHCDIKPGNILRDSRKSVLIDFGFASFVRIADPADVSASTPGYQAPEQLDDDINPEDYEYPVDLFSLGVTLVEAGTGWLPWDLPNRFKESRRRLEYLQSQKNPGVRNIRAAYAEYQEARQQYAETIARTSPRLDGLDADQLEIVAPLLRLNAKMRGTAAETLAKIQLMLPDGSSRKSATVDYVARKATSPGSIKNQSIKDALQDAKQEIKEAWQQGSEEAKKSSPIVSKPRRYSVALRLSAYGGFLGIDRIYLGRYWTAFLKFYTFGGLGWWWLFDLHNLIQNNTRTKKGAELEGDKEDIGANRRSVRFAYFVLVPFVTVILTSSIIIGALS